MELKQEELDKLTSLSLKGDTHNNGGILYLKDNNFIYKIFRNLYSYEKETERNIDFQIIHNVPCSPKVHDKIFVDGQFNGYSMDYEKDSMTFREATKENNFSLNSKLHAITDVYKALKYLHSNGIYLGDIHSDNFLIDKNGNGYLIDLENMRFPGDEFKFQQCYLIKPNDDSPKLNIPNAYTDNAKTMISALTLLTGMDLENMINKQSHDINLEELRKKIILPFGDDNLTTYIDYLMNSSDDNEIKYFDDFLFEQYNIKDPVNGKAR